MFKQSRWMLLLVIPFGIICLMLAASLLIGINFIGSAFPSQQETDFYVYRTKTTGIVTYSEYNIGEHLGDDNKPERNDFYRVWANYMVNGRQYEVKGVFSDLKSVGSQLDVFYNSRNPSQSSFSEPIPPVVNTVRNLIIGGTMTGGSMFFIGATVYYLFLRGKITLFRRKKVHPDKAVTESRYNQSK